MSCVKLWMTWWYYTIILYPGAGVHSSGAHSGVCIVLRRRDDVKVPEMGSLCPLVRPQLNISHNLGDIELLITTNYSHFPPRNEAHDNGSVTLVHLVHCVNKHTPTFPIMIRNIMDNPMRRLQQLILIFQTIKQLSQCPFLTRQYIITLYQTSTISPCQQST